MTGAIKVQKLAEAIHNELGLDVEINNYGKCLRVEDGKHFIWIRLLNFENHFIVDINNISFVESEQRKGLCDRLIKVIRSRQYVDRAYISSVCSDKMYNFVRKHKMAYNAASDLWEFKNKL